MILEQSRALVEPEESMCLLEGLHQIAMYVLCSRMIAYVCSGMVVAVVRFD